MRQPPRAFSIVKVFAMTYVGYVVGSIVFAAYVSFLDFKPNGFVGPNVVFVGNIMFGAVTGLLYLPLPLWVSSELNGSFHDTTMRMWAKAIFLGFLICLLLSSVTQRCMEGHASAPHILGAAAAAFVLALFTFTRRASKNALMSSNDA